MTLRRHVAVAAALVAGVTAASLPVAPADAAAKTRHDLTVAGEEIGGSDTNQFRVYGTVSTFKGRNLTVQIRVNGGAWTFWKKTPTAAPDGSFSERLYGGKRGTKVCYKIVVPATKSYRLTKAKAGCIRTS